jgi:hypothetical protein
MYLGVYCMSLMQTVEFPHAQHSIVAKNLKAAFLFGSANNKYLSSISSINGLFFHHFKETLKVTSHCLLCL